MGSTKYDNFSLADDVEETALRKNITQSQACRILTKRKPWKDYDHRPLYGRYTRFLDRYYKCKPEERLAYLQARLTEAQAFPPATVPQASLNGLGLLAMRPEWLIDVPIRRILEQP